VLRQPVELFDDPFAPPNLRALDFMDRTVLDRAEKLQRRIYQLRDSL
jgi:hypothetical protein